MIREADLVILSAIFLVFGSTNEGELLFILFWFCFDDVV